MAADWQYYSVLGGSSAVVSSAGVAVIASAQRTLINTQFLKLSLRVIRMCA
jgi:hypothetical protein